MTDKKLKRKVERRPVAKVINVQPPRPADDLFNPFAEAKAAEGAAAPTPVTPVTDVTPVTPVTRVREDAAPKRDFTRTANSIVREAVPAGVFTGKGKQLYDYLYSQTRGAIVPKMSARIPTETVMKGAGMTRHPFRAHIARLISFGLVSVEERPGKHGGNVYTVYLPEEADPSHRGDRGDTGHTGDKVPVEQGSQAHRGDRGLSPDFQRASGESKTLIQDKERIDDERVPRPLAATERELTGKNLPADKWAEVWEVLSTELRIAAGRTTVSSVPAFLAEHLRRRLWKKDKRQIAEEGKAEIPQSAIRVDVSKCPDCFGAGMWYPEGFDKGVARCPHAKLSKTEEGN
jgi:hypothetical protein